MRFLLGILLLCLLPLSPNAQIRAANIFGDHMVFQRNKPIHVWGWAKSGEPLTVEFAGQKANTKTSKNGSWSVVLPPMTEGGPFDLVIKGKQVIRYTDIMIGEVWLCSGQSNMEWILKNTDSAADEIARANHPMIRHIEVPKNTSLNPEQDIQKANWEICSPATAGNFTAVGYYYALKLYQSLNVPIGLIHSSWGGTHVETWISAASFFAMPEFSGMRERMPASADTIIARRMIRTDRIMKSVQDNLPTAGEAFGYRQPGLDDHRWKEMQVPGEWENKGMPEIDGIVWFRKSFELPDGFSGQGTVLKLAMIDDEDSTFLNGEFVGAEKEYNKPRVYSIRPGLLKSGLNTIAVKVTDGGGGGGFHGSKEDMYLSIADKRVALDGGWKYRIESLSNTSRSINPNAYPTLLYNAMIHPLVQYPIKGAIWYQGESNAGRAEQYRRSFPAMISDWRKQWRDSFPFYFVQLTHWRAAGGNSRNGGSTWAELREAQELTLRLPYTGMAVITDIGNTADIHPRNKKDVGQRLALQALTKTYQVPMPSESPLYQRMVLGQHQVILYFTNLYDGWVVRNPYGYINGFEVAGADKKFHLARARIKGKEILLESDAVENPVAVRYCWSDDPNDVNLFNSIGLPARPFRTDNWPMKTQGAGFEVSRN